MRLHLKADPHEVNVAVKKELSSRSLREFFRLFWHVLEPGTELVMGPALEAILEHLESVARGQIRDLLINVPPGFSKSMATSVFLPAWIWGPFDRPDKRIISTSYAADLAIRDNLYCRKLMRSEEYQECWGDSFQFTGDQNAKMRYENTRGGWKQTASVGSALIGHRGDLIIVDDPHSTKSSDSEIQRRSALRWFTETLPTRKNDMVRSSTVVIMQRLHTNDVSGLILKKKLGFEHLCIPMEYSHDHPHKSTRWTDWRTEKGQLADPVRFPRKAVEDLKRFFRSEGGSYAEAGQLDQRPVPRGGGMFKEKWFKFRDYPPTADEIDGPVVRGWDLAATKDERAAFTAGVKGCRLKTGETVILDVKREQLEPSGVYAMMLRVAEQDGRDVIQSIPQDPGQAGKDQKRHIASALFGFLSHFSPESGSKETRAALLASQADVGNVFVVVGDWNDDFIRELVEFPRGAWKDQADAASRMFAKLAIKRPVEIPVSPRRF